MTIDLSQYEYHAPEPQQPPKPAPQFMKKLPPPNPFPTSKTSPDIHKPASRSPHEDLISIIRNMDVGVLLNLRHEIDKTLPSTSLSGMNLETELVMQYHRVKELQRVVMEDLETPANQRAQVAGQVASVLGQLTKMQSEFHTAERFKSIENLMIEYMKRLPVDVAEAFLNEYEAIDARE